MAGSVSFGNKRSYEDFIKQIPNSIQPVFDSLRKFCLSLGDNVIEDVRMHRIVFGKSMTFRWFADMEPASYAVLLKIQKTRKEQPIEIEFKQGDELEPVKEAIKNAYDSIH